MEGVSPRPGPLARIVSGYRAAGLRPRTPALPAVAFVRLKAALLAGSLIRYDSPSHMR